jgi:hypothetical protein
MASWESVVGSWTCFAGVIVLGWWYYRADGSLKRVGRQKPNGAIEPERLVKAQVAPKNKRKKEKAQNQDTSDAASDTQDSKVAPVKGNSTKTELHNRKNGKNVQSNKHAETSAVDAIPTTSRAIEKDEDLDAKEFARQMAKAKAGTTFNASKKDDQRVRTQKQSKMNGAFGSLLDTNTENIASTTSSNTGADADDDMSPVVSPELHASTSFTDTTGVGDMLEASEPGPASLRITQSTAPQKTRPKTTKKVEEAETKKQRQARMRREREKEANREVEAQRKVLEEKQRRTAREAEGRPAKNGNGWTYNSGLPANSWTQGKTPEVKTVDGPLLDTQEETQPDTQSTSNEVKESISTTGQTNGHPSTAKTNGTAQTWENGLPSEEEQLRIIKEQSEDSEWTTIPSNKRAKRKQIVDEKPKEAPKQTADFDVMI